MSLIEDTRLDVTTRSTSADQDAEASASLDGHPNSDTRLLLNLGKRLEAYRDIGFAPNLSTQRGISRHVRNLERLSKWLAGQPDKSLSDVLTKHRACALPPSYLHDLLEQYKFSLDGGSKCPDDASRIAVSVRVLQDLMEWERMQELVSIALPGQAADNAPTAGDAQATWEMVDLWFKNACSNLTDEQVLQQQTPDMSHAHRGALISLAGWIEEKFGVKDKLGCIKDLRGGLPTNQIVDLYCKGASKSNKDNIRGAVKTLYTGKRVAVKRNLDMLLHAEDKRAIDLIVKHYSNKSKITAFKEFAVWARGQDPDLSLVKIIAYPDLQVRSQILLNRFKNSSQLNIYRAHAKSLILSAQNNEALKRSLIKLDA